jgi:glycosyltransferase involved in cell wall biosynthesis
MEATIGGTKRHLLELARGLRGAGWEVEVACPRVRGAAFGDVSFWDDLAAAGIPTHEVAMERRPLSAVNALAARRLAGLLGRRRFDVVHAHSSIAGAVARLALLFSGALTGALSGGRHRPRLVYTPHGLAFLTPGSAPRRHFYLAVERALGLVTDRLIAVSPTEATAATEHGVVPPERVVTVPNGVDLGDLASPARRAAVRRAEGWGGGPVVGTVARMTPQKDPQTWLAVAARLAAERPEARFVWVWGGEEEPEVRRRAGDLGLEGRLIFPGYRADARHLLGAFDVFLLTSRFEGLPYTPIEALAAGTPVVATDVVGTRDVVRDGETGLLAPPGDVAALAAQVARLLDDGALARRLAVAGRADVLARFSLEAMVARTAATYEALLVAPLSPGEPLLPCGC